MRGLSGMPTVSRVVVSALCHHLGVRAHAVTKRSPRRCRTRSIIVTGCCLSLIGCSWQAPAHHVRPSLAVLTPEGSALVASSGVGPKDLGTFAITYSTATIDMQASCLGSVAVST